MIARNDDGELQTILVVDDAPETIAVLSSTLGSEFRVLAAPDGERALTMAQAAPRPDIILLDLMMPAMDGYEVLRRLKGNPSTQDIPVIFVTAPAEQADDQKGLDLGAVDYIAKPISPPILRARVRTHLALAWSNEVRRWLSPEMV